MGGVISSAKDELKLADHMVYITLPLLGDRMIFLSAVSHLGKSINKLIIAYLEREKKFKRLEFVPPIDMAVNLFITKYSQRIGVNDHVSMIKTINSFNNVRARSSIKLKRDDKFIIISPEYNMVTLTEVEVKKYIRQTSKFISVMEGVLSEV